VFDHLVERFNNACLRTLFLLSEGFPADSSPCEHGLGDIDTHDMTTVSLTVVPPLIPEVLLCDENNPQEGESEA
jgi:hypothetical protein